MKNYQPREGTKARQALDAITEAGQMTPVQLATAIGTSPKNITAILWHCMEHKLIVKVGRGAGTHFRLASEEDHIADISLTLDTVDEAEAEGDLAISIWSDGDVMVQGATVHTEDGNKIVFSRAQAQQLVRMLARPAVAL
jgi:hypothetical protein